MQLDGQFVLILALHLEIIECDHKKFNSSLNQGKNRCLQKKEALKPKEEVKEIVDDSPIHDDNPFGMFYMLFFSLRKV